MEFAELDGEDAYEILGVPGDASIAEIRRAHRELIRTHHPDLVLDTRAKALAEARARLLNAARDVLTSDRERYDTYLRPSEPDADVDPWGAAEPGRPGPEDPWKDAESGPPPPDSPPPPPPPGPAPGPIRTRTRRRRMAGLAGAGIGLLGFVAVMVSGVIGGDSADSSGSRTETPGDAPSSWSGVVTTNSGRTWTVEFKLPAPADYDVAVYATGACRGGDRIMSRDPGHARFSIQFPSGRSTGPECVNGYVELRGNLRSGDAVTATVFSEAGDSKAAGLVERKSS